MSERASERAGKPSMVYGGRGGESLGAEPEGAGPARLLPRGSVPLHGQERETQGGDGTSPQL